MKKQILTAMLFLGTTCAFAQFPTFSTRGQQAVAPAQNTVRHFGGYLGILMDTKSHPKIHGVLIKDVAFGGPAALAGIKKADILEAVNGQPVVSVADFQAKISPLLSPGTQVMCRILRKGRESEVAAVIAPLRATVTFVMVENNGTVLHALPNWAATWLMENMEKYSGVKFQVSGPASGQANYVVAFSFSSSVLNGFQPVTHTETSTSTSNVSGNGTVTDDYGNSWDYTTNGQVDTTTTTTKTTNEAYTINSDTVYLTAYNEKGEAIAQCSHVYSSQQGGNQWNAAGHNLGNALGAIHSKAHLMQTILKDIGLGPSK